jgi:hypothetical protein
MGVLKSVGCAVVSMVSLQRIDDCCSSCYVRKPALVQEKSVCRVQVVARAILGREVAGGFGAVILARVGKSGAV